MNEQEWEQSGLWQLGRLHTGSTYEESVLAAVAYYEIEAPSPAQHHAFFEAFHVKPLKAF